ncbi:MAG: cold-shock protein [Flavobacteriales bacterium]|nr:MAG: cold-shock protein [Flavobacteriales bacterium]
MSNGTVKFYNSLKGFGFIEQEEGGKDVYVNETALVDQIKDGDKVSFDIEEGEKGLNAVNVKQA